MKTTTDITFHGEKGWRFAFVEEFTIREAMPEGFAIYKDIDGEDTLIWYVDTADEAIAYVNTLLTCNF